MIKEKKRAVVVFSLIYVLFFAVLVHFLFSPGLAFVRIGDELFIKNESIRSIRGIRVYDEFGRTIDCIGELSQANSAFDRAKIFLPPNETIETIKASAPFHPEIHILAVKKSDEESKFHISLSANAPPEIGKEFNFAVTACSFGESVPSASIEIKTDESFLEGKAMTYSFALEKGECKEFKFSLRPKKRGKTTIETIFSTTKVIKREETIITIGG